MSLYLVDESGETEIVGRKAQREIGEVYVEDYGVIMRSPHPRNPGRDRGIDISDRRLAFWALVRGVESKSDGLLDVDGVTIERVGVYSRS